VALAAETLPVNGLARLLVRGVDLVNRRGKSVGVRLVRLTGKRPYAIHPKHLVDQAWHDWYVPYLSATDRVLDVGTSNAAHLLQAAKHCQSIVGVDYDAAQLQIAEGELRARGVGNARVFAWDITQPLPFADRTFDTILFLDVIEHLVPRVAVLREIHRLLTDDGQLLVSGPNSQTRWRATLRRAGLFAYSDPDHKIEYTAEEFVAELRAGGFEPEGGLMPVVLDTPWAGAIDAMGGVSLRLYDRLSRWKREAAVRRPGESTGFRARARKARR
jgi:SAM-dependent methyltransferase